MDALSVIVGVGMVCAIMIIFAFIVSDNHPILKMIVLIFCIILLIVIPHSLIESKVICDTVVANSTVVNSSTTSYEYTTHCYQGDSTASVLLLKVVTWFYRVFAAYVIVYLFWWFGMLVVERYKGGRS
jgi:hypothetical protein